jgi:hypothetical protein
MEKGARVLSHDVAMWKTPKAIFGDHPGMAKHKPGQEEHLTMQAIAFSPPAPVTSTPGCELSPSDPGCCQPQQRKRLNSYFAEWLMGWPPGWTIPAPIDFGALGMEFVHYKRQLHFCISRLVREF